MTTLARMKTTTDYRDSWINPRFKIAALWASMLFVFVYVDVFSLYRADVRADLEAGKIAVFTIGQGYLLGVTVYVALPILMLFLSLVLPVRVSWPKAPEAAAIAMRDERSRPADSHDPGIPEGDGHSGIEDVRHGIE